MYAITFGSSSVAELVDFVQSYTFYRILCNREGAKNSGGKRQA